MSRASGVAFGYYPSSASPAAPVPETKVQAAVSRADLWALGKAAVAFLRVTESRFDSEQFRRAKERLERCKEKMPPEVWA